MRVTKLNSLLTTISAVLVMVIVSMNSQRTLAQGQHKVVWTELASRRTDIKLPDLPPAIDGLSRSVRSPEQIDEATERLGIAPRLLNFNLATPVDLSEMGLGKAVHIPVQISNKEGGRKSLYFLEPGEEVLAGVFVNDDGLALRYVKRLDGKGTPAKTGDIYETRVTTAQGKAVYQEQGRLEVLDPEHGKGEFVPVNRSGEGRTRPGRRKIWILWSCVLVDRNRGYY